MIENKRKEVIVENKCGGGIDLSITNVCREKKKIKKIKKKIYTRQEEEKICVRQERKEERKKKGLMSPFPNDLGDCFEVKV